MDTSIMEETPQHLVYNTNEVAKILGVSVNTVRCWRNQGIGPKYFHMGGKMSLAMYAHEDLVAWIDECKQKSEIELEEKRAKIAANKAAKERAKAQKSEAE